MTGARAGRRRVVGAAVVCGMLMMGVSGCALPSADQGPTFSQQARDNEDLDKAQKHFLRGEFGLAEKHYRRTIESEPNNYEAWLGLAAAYDQLSRYDLADRSYGRAKALKGETAILLNNMGYSRMLRGDLARARRLLVRAQQKDPYDERIVSNIREFNTKLTKIGRRPIEL